MAKTLETIAFAALEVGIAVFAPEILPATWSLLAVSAATAAAEIAVGLAANALIGPSLPKGLGGAVNNQVSRLYVTTDTTAPRKIVFGDTAAATDLRYQAYTGTNQRYYEQVIAVASHKVNAIYEIWFDNEKAWTSAGGVQGRYAGFLTVDVCNEGTSSNGIAIDSTWTSHCTLTGCAYVHLKFDLLGNASDGSNNSPFASGVTSRVTVRTQGALRYDPRLDSSVAGGSGTQRATDRTTWAWDASGSRNPALQLLWYLLGWAINDKIAVGMGIPATRIDLASFAVAANACDESIALNGGGTEPRYRSDGVVTEGDDRQSVTEAMCATMNAVMRDAGGKLSLTILHNDLATPIASFTEADILGDEKWEQTPDLSSTFNICRGRRVDPSDNALYQLVDIPEASLASNDGIDRIDTMDVPFVQSNGQAQRLLKQRLERKQYQGKYALTGGSRWWQTGLGDVIELSHQGLGWSGKLFRVTSQSIARTGESKMTLIEENAALYAWDNSEAAAVTPGAPTIYDPLNSPLLAGLNSALTSVYEFSADGVLDVNEKQQLILIVNTIVNEKAGIDAQAAALSIAAELTAYDSAYASLIAYLSGLSPAYSDTTLNTPIVRADFNTAFEDFYSARQALLNKMYGVLSDGLDVALSTINDMALDGILDRSEKALIVREWNQLSNEKAGIDAQAAALSIAAELTAYDNAYSTLDAYLTGLSPAFDDTTQNTSIVRSTWDAYWESLYETRQALLNKIDAVAATQSNWSDVVDDNGGKPDDGATGGDNFQPDPNITNPGDRPPVWNTVGGSILVNAVMP